MPLNDDESFCIKEICHSLFEMNKNLRTVVFHLEKDPRFQDMNDNLKEISRNIRYADKSCNLSLLDNSTFSNMHSRLMDTERKLTSLREQLEATNKYLERGVAVSGFPTLFSLLFFSMNILLLIVVIKLW